MTDFNHAFNNLCNQLASGHTPDCTIRSNDGDYLYYADEHEVRQRQREEDAMEAERREQYRDRANKGV